MDRVTGSIAYRERMALSPAAIVQVKLLDVSLADAPAKQIGSQEITNPGQVPIEFVVPYDRAQIDDRHSYSIRAEIYDRGRLLFTTDTLVSVLTRGAGAEAQLNLVRVSGKARETPDSPLTETRWKLLSVDGEPVPPGAGGREVHLVLGAEDAQAKGFSGCNQFHGRYELEGDVLKFGPLAGTMMACPDGMDLESAFLKSLASSDRYELEGQELRVYSQHRMLLRFTAVHPD